MSIIVVGIGDADFGTLKAVLADVGDNRPGTTWNEGQRMMRDIVQFVAVRDFLGVDADNQEYHLRKKVLSKIPAQYLEYMKIQKIPPKPPRNTTVERYCA